MSRGRELQEPVLGVGGEQRQGVLALHLQAGRPVACADQITVPFVLKAYIMYLAVVGRRHPPS